MSETESTYQTEYDTAMAALDAAAEGKQPEVTTAAVEAEPEAVVEAATPEVQEPVTPAADDPLELKRQLEEMRAQIASNDKALKDTQRAFHERSAELARVRREQQLAQRQTPELLESIPELADAIRHVQQGDVESKQQSYEDTHQAAIVAVQDALPEAGQWLADPDFMKAMEARRESVGAEKFDLDPRVMVRELTAEKLARERSSFEAQKQAAIDAARKDFEKAAKAKSSMTMPGASAGSGRVTSTGALTAADIENMSDAAFKRLQAKTLGF